MSAFLWFVFGVLVGTPIGVAILAWAKWNDDEEPDG